MLGAVGCNFRGVGLLAEADGHAFAAVQPHEFGLFGALGECLRKVGCNAQAKLVVMLRQSWL